MGINTDLNVDPYYDDFDEAKQFNKVLFKPAKAVQARELTQLQTILQKQVERFGSNVYKEGTIISGINMTARDDLFYVKLKDQSGFNDPTIYNEVVQEDGTKVNYIVTGQVSGLRAEIIKGSSGFETQNPDLKTFFIKYLNTAATGVGGTDVKQFLPGETLEIVLSTSPTAVVSSVTVTNLSNHVGKSFGVSCEEGVIYQKGHFIFVDSQFIIVEKYSNVPSNRSVGFKINENLINSNSETSLLDNASGFNNYNAPGADRLQLVPTLISYTSAIEPDEFFALIRYVNGEAVRLRDVTQFNSIGDELARRTYEESGNYATVGLNATLEVEAGVPRVSISQGKAFVLGREVTTVGNDKLDLSPVTTTQTKPDQAIGVTFGQYYGFTDAGAGGTEVPAFSLNGTRYAMWETTGATVIGYCSVSSIETGRIYVYAINKEATHEGITPRYIGNNSNMVVNLDLGSDLATNELQESSNGCRIFDTGKFGISSIASTQLVKRVRSVVTLTADYQATINSTYGGGGSSEIQPVPAASTIIAIDEDGRSWKPDTAILTSAADLLITFPSGIGASEVVNLYYNQVETGEAITNDSLQLKTGYIKSTVASGIGSLGLPNVVKIISILDQTGGDGAVDVTDKFRLVNNQKDAYYDTSYVKLKAGETYSNTPLLIQMSYLDRTTTTGGGYLTANSYSHNSIAGIHTVPPFQARNGLMYSLYDSYDFRPYASSTISNSPSQSTTNAPVPQAIDLSFGPFSINIANNSTIKSSQEYYLSRVDRVVIDEYSNIKIVKGDESENPKEPLTPGLYSIATISIPGNSTAISGDNAISLDTQRIRNYTMEDIGDIDRRVQTLTEIVALTVAEMSANDLIITDSAGLDRFKNGILADTFKNLRLADMVDPDFKASIDRENGTVSPSVRQFPVDLRVGTGHTGSIFPSTASLATDGSIVNIIEQPYATNFRNCVSNYYNYKGNATIHPPFTSDYDVIQNPAVNIDIDLATPMLDLVNNLQEFVPLTTSTTTDLGWRSTGRSRGIIANRLNQTTTRRLQSRTSTSRKNVGNFVTDVHMNPYLKRQHIKILVTGLRPNTTHYFFFDGKDVNDSVSPAYHRSVGGSLNVRRVYGGWWRRRRNRIVKTDANGTLSAVFVIPANTFFVGQNVLEIADVDQYSSIDSGSTSHARATHRGYSFSLNKSQLNTTTRTVDFNTDVNVTTRIWQRRRRDPIAQTFRVRSADTNNANVLYVSELDVFFKNKSATTGVTLEIREVENGYPSKKVLPFASKHLDSSAVIKSPTGITPTTFTFDNPVKLNANAEYCFVVIPDANAPDYLIWTSKVGENTVADQRAVTNDWGDGALFTSTNDSAWKSYQDEDIKFTIKRYNFNTTGNIDLVPNDVEFLTIRENEYNTAGDISSGVKHFEDGEIVYIKKSASYTCGVQNDQQDDDAPSIVTISGDVTGSFAVGDYIYIEENSTSDNKLATRIESVTANGISTVIYIEDPFHLAGNGFTAFVCVGAEVSYYNKNKPNKIHLKESSARKNNFIDDNSTLSFGNFVVGDTYTIESLGSNPADANDVRDAWREVGVAGDVTPAIGTVFKATKASSGVYTSSNGTARPNTQVIIGIDSGASAKITSTDVEKLSYFQSQVQIDDTLNSFSEIELHQIDSSGTLSIKPIASTANVYAQGTPNIISSTSELVRQLPNDVLVITPDFKLKAKLSTGISTVTPLLDVDLSMINAYQYNISSNLGTTSQWVARDVSLKDGYPAEGLKVLVTAHRPAGTFIDVYGRFIQEQNNEVKTSWIQLESLSGDLYSSSVDKNDLREFEYQIKENTTIASGGINFEFSNFQVKFVLRHAVDSELTTKELNNITPDIHLFPEMYEFRAIAIN